MNDALAAGAASAIEPGAVDPIPRVRAEIDAPDVAPSLPGDHPAWQRDVLSISARARAVIAALRPLTLAVLSFWDHRLRDLVLGSRRLTIDPSGSYRLH